MQQKSTGELLQELSGCADLRGYLSANADNLQPQPLEQLLEHHRKARGLSRAEVAARSSMNKIYVYQIFSGYRRPGRDSLLCLCFGLGLSVAQTQTMLLRGGFGQLYVRDKRESVIYYAPGAGNEHHGDQSAAV